MFLRDFCPKTASHFSEIALSRQCRRFSADGGIVAGLRYHEHFALIPTGTVLAAEPSRGAAFRAFDLARAAGLPLIFDVDYRPYSWSSAAAAMVGARVGCAPVMPTSAELDAFLADHSGPTAA